MDSSGLWSVFLLELSLVGVEVGLMCEEAAGEGGRGRGIKRGRGGCFVTGHQGGVVGGGGAQWSV